MRQQGLEDEIHTVVVQSLNTFDKVFTRVIGKYLLQQQCQCRNGFNGIDDDTKNHSPVHEREVLLSHRQRCGNADYNNTASTVTGVLNVCGCSQCVGIGRCSSDYDENTIDKLLESFQSLDIDLSRDDGDHQQCNCIRNAVLHQRMKSKDIEKGGRLIMTPEQTTENDFRASTKDSAQTFTSLLASSLPSYQEKNSISEPDLLPSNFPHRRAEFETVPVSASFHGQMNDSNLLLPCRTASCRTSLPLLFESKHGQDVTPVVRACCCQCADNHNDDCQCRVVGVCCRNECYENSTRYYVSLSVLLSKVQSCRFNKYWLVQNKYAEVISNLNYVALQHYVENNDTISICAVGFVVNGNNICKFNGPSNRDDTDPDPHIVSVGVVASHGDDDDDGDDNENNVAVGGQRNPIRRNSTPSFQSLQAKTVVRDERHILPHNTYEDEHDTNDFILSLKVSFNIFLLLFLLKAKKRESMW